MSIRHLALELYRAQQQVSRLEQTLAAAPLASQEAIRQELRDAQATLRQLRKMMDGAKENARATPSLIRRN